MDKNSEYEAALEWFNRANWDDRVSEIQTIRTALQLMSTHAADVERLMAGGVVVPREATEEMIEAGYLADPLSCDVEESEKVIYPAIYTAMLKASQETTSRDLTDNELTKIEETKMPSEFEHLNDELTQDKTGGNDE